MAGCLHSAALQNQARAFTFSEQNNTGEPVNQQRW